MGDGDGSSVWWREGASTSADAIVLPVNQTSLFEDNEEAPVLMTGGFRALRKGKPRVGRWRRHTAMTMAIRGNETRPELR
jgi:hypothetical protein